MTEKYVKIAPLVKYSYDSSELPGEESMTAIKKIHFIKL